jgi:hypothetical protein
MRRRACFIISALGGIMVTACGQGSKSQLSEPLIVVLDEVAYADELRQSYPRFEWPSDYRPDLEQLIAATRPASDEHIQQGVSRQVLAVVNTCAWYQSWDAGRQRGDTAATVKAMQVITEVLVTYPPDQDPDGRTFVQEAADHARAGNPDLARQYVLANCDTTIWVGH